MAYKNCIAKLKKAGVKITPEHEAALEAAIAEGLSDDEAVRRLALMAHQNVIDIVNRARNEGAKVAPVKNPVTELAKFQSRKLEGIAKRRTKINDEINTATNRFSDIVDAEAFIRANIFSMMRKKNQLPSEVTEEFIKSIDLSDDKLVLNAMLEFQFRPELNFKRLGISGESANDMLDSFRAQQVEKQTLIDEIHGLALEQVRLEEQVNSIFSGVGEQKFYQLSPQTPKLVVRHNLTSENIAKADELGGLAVPSMAVMPEGQPFTGFGEVTFIGTDELADPTKMPLFDADGYTVRFPMPEYKPAPASVRDPLLKELVVWERLWEGRGGSISYYVDRHMKDHPNPQLVIWKMIESPAVQAWYLSEVWGEDLTPTMKDKQPHYKWGWDDDVIEFFSKVDNPLQYNWEDPKRRQIMQDAGRLVERKVKASIAKRKTVNGEPYTKEEVDSIFASGAYLNSDGSLSENRFRQLKEDVDNKGSQELDHLTNVDVLKARLSNNSKFADILGMAFGSEGASHMHFKSWVENKVGESFGEPRIKIGGKWEEYNLENIVRKMKGKLKGTEFMDNMMNEGLMRAIAAHRFKTLEEMRQRSELIIDSPDEVQALRDVSQAKMLAWTSQMAQFYTREDAQGYVDAYEAGDEAKRAIVRWSTQGKMSTADDMHDALVAHGFDEVPDFLIDEGMDAAMTWLAVPVPYFEGKPQRAVMFEEFAGAVIPSNASPETRAILAKRGLPFKEYQVGPNIDEHQTRLDATNEFTQQLNNQGERTLFQSEIGFTSGLLTAARTMPFTKTMKDGVEVGTDAKQILNTLRKQPNVKQEEIDAVGLEEWAEGMGSFTHEQLIEYIDQGGVHLKETYYAGEEVLRTPINFTQERASDEAHFDSIVDFEYDTGYAEFSTEIFDMRDRDDPWGPNFTVHIDKDAGNVSVQVQETQEWLEVPGGMNNQEMFHAKQAMEKYIYDQREVPGAAGPVRWTQWTLPAPDRGQFGDQGPPINHREIVLNVPTVGGYNYLLEDLTEIDHPDAGLTLPTQDRERVEREQKLFHFISASSPMPGKSPTGGELRRAQVFKIKKKNWPTIDEAKRYIMEEKPVDAPVGANFSSHAFPQSNIIAWMRVNDRMGPKGEKILFVEEIQSDLHQAGLTDGYNYTTEQIERAQAEFEKIEVKTAKMLQNLEEPFVGYDNGREALNEWMNIQDEPLAGGMRDPFESLTKKQRAMMNNYSQVRRRTALIEAGGPTPNMPFKGDAWAELAMKRVIRMAVEQGYDQVAWTTAEQQLERYDIDEHFSKIEWDPRSESLHTYDSEGRQLDTMHKDIDELEEMFGAERVLEMNRQIDEKRSHWTISPVYVASKQRSDMTGEELAFADATLGAAQNTGTFNLEMSPNDIILDDDDQFIGTYEREWIKQNGVAFALVDENGEMVRQSGGDYQMWEYFDGAEDGRDEFAFEQLPELTNIDVVDEEGKGLRRRYDELMVNVTNRALRKLDKSAKVKRLGVQMEGGGTVLGQRIEREGGGNLVSGVVDPGAFYVSGWTDETDPNMSDRKQISPRFDTYDEAEAWHDNITMGYAMQQHGFDITPEVQVAAMEGQTLFQDRERGSITFDNENRAIIRMTKAKDLSTFLHEASHLYLEMMADLAEMPDASAGVIDDYAKILSYLGVNNRREVGRDQHELFARSFEAYLREGKAPTAELQSTFTTISGWMLRIYDIILKLLNPGETLDAEIRGVFDRLVASEAAISQSEDMMGYVALYQNAEEMGVSPEVFEVYRRAMQEGHDEAVEFEVKKMIKAQHWAQEQWWKDELKKVTEQVRADAHDMPVYQVLAMLQKGKMPDGTEPPVQPFKLSKASVMQVARGSQTFVNNLPGRGKSAIYTIKNEGVDVELVADMYGFASGKEMLQTILEAPKMEVWIKDEADRIMQENHPNPMNSPELIDEATRAVHNQKRRQILGAELRALRNKQKEDAKIVKATKDTIQREEREAREANAAMIPKGENLAAIKAAAAEIVGGQQIRDINPHRYLVAERKAGRLAFEANGKKNYEEAYRQKRIQIMNFEAYRAAVKAKDQAARDAKYLQSFEKKGNRRNRLRERMGKAGKLEQIDAILENIRLVNISGSKIDQINLERELAAAVEENLLVIPDDILARMTHPDGVNWKELTANEFAGIRDVVKQLEHQARTDLKAIINGEEVVIQEAVDAVSSSIIENGTIVDVPRVEDRHGKSNAREAVGHWLRSGTIARLLDKSNFGAVTRNIIVPIRRAMTEKFLPRQFQAQEDIAEIYKRHYSTEELGQLAKPLDDLTMGEPMSKANIIALALNWGSESNRDAVLGGVRKDAYGNKSPAFTQQNVDEALAKMDARDWAFVQDIWEFENQFYSEMAATEKRRRGVAPEKIEGMAFEIRTIDGEMITVKGQYHPLQYDPRHGGKVTNQEIKAMETMVKNGGFLSASTRAGATHERTKNHGRVVKLSLNTINHNVDELIRDLTIGDEINLVNRILQSEEVGNAARNTNNAEVIAELKLWLLDAAVGEIPARSSIERGLSYMRVGFTKSKLAFNLYVTALQITGLFQSMAVLGVRAYTVGVGKFIAAPIDNYQMVMEKSKFMKARYGVMQQFDKDVADTKHFLKGHFGGIPTKTTVLWDRASHFYFWPIAKAQSLVDVTTWMGAYEQAINSIGTDGSNIRNESDAVLAADAMVENAQTSGLFSDRSGIERGTLSINSRQQQFVRLWTTLISYMLAKGNIAYEKTRNTDFKDPKKIADLALDLMMLFMVEGIASSLLYGQGPDEDDDESIPAWVGKVTLESMTAGIPLLREWQAVKYGSGNTAVGSFFNDAWDFTNQVAQLEVDEPLVKSGVKTFGTLFHLPASQVNRMVEALFADEPASLHEYFLGVDEDE